MKEIVSLKKNLNNETVLQIYVCFMPRIGIVAYRFNDSVDLLGGFQHKKHSQRETKNSSLYEPQLRDS